MKEKIKGKERAAIGLCIRSTSDIVPKWEDIRNSYIPPNWNDMRSIADMTSYPPLLEFNY
jgi:hypothetical protein